MEAERYLSPPLDTIVTSWIASEWSSPIAGGHQDGSDRTSRRRRRRQRRPRSVRLRAAPAPAPALLQLVRRRVLVHLAGDRHLHAVHPRSRDAGRSVLLDVAGRGARAVLRRVEVRGGLNALPVPRVGVPVDEVPRALEGVGLVPRLDLPV